MMRVAKRIGGAAGACALLAGILTCCTPATGQTVQIDQLAVTRTRTGFTVSGAGVASGLNTGPAPESETVYVVADVAKGTSLYKWPVLPTGWVARKPSTAQTQYCIGRRMLTRAECDGTRVVIVGIARTVLRSPPVWSSYGGKSQWRRKAPDSVRFTFNGNIAGEYADMPMRIRAYLMVAKAVSPTTWPTRTLVHHVAHTGTVKNETLARRATHRRPGSTGHSAVPRDSAGLLREAGHRLVRQTRDFLTQCGIKGIDPRRTAEALKLAITPGTRPPFGVRHTSGPATIYATAAQLHEYVTTEVYHERFAARGTRPVGVSYAAHEVLYRQIGRFLTDQLGSRRPHGRGAAAVGSPWQRTQPRTAFRYASADLVCELMARALGRPIRRTTGDFTERNALAVLKRDATATGNEIPGVITTFLLAVLPKHPAAAYRMFREVRTATPSRRPIGGTGALKTWLGNCALLQTSDTRSITRDLMIGQAARAYRIVPGDVSFAYELSNPATLVKLSAGYQQVRPDEPGKIVKKYILDAGRTGRMRLVGAVSLWVRDAVSGTALGVAASGADCGVTIDPDGSVTVTVYDGSASVAPPDGGQGVAVQSGSKYVWPGRRWRAAGAVSDRDLRQAHEERIRAEKALMALIVTRSIDTHINEIRRAQQDYFRANTKYVDLLRRAQPR